MRLFHGKPGILAFWGEAKEAQDHLRISEVGECGNLVNEGCGEPAAGHRQLVHREPAEPVLQDRYDRSVERIESCIYTLATAVSALDSVEGKLIEARSQIETLRREGRRVDAGKVHRMLVQLADHVNMTIGAMDRHGVNLLRDSHLSLRLAEIDDETERAVGVELTIISLDKLMAYRLKGDMIDEAETSHVIDNFASIVFHNVQVLSSAILALMASRDYTDEVTRLVLTESISRRGGEMASLEFNPNDREPLSDDAPDPEHSRRSLVELIDRMRENRALGR